MGKGSKFIQILHSSVVRTPLVPLSPSHATAKAVFACYTNQSGIVGGRRVINHKTLSDIIYSHVNHRIVRFLRHGNWRVYGYRGCLGSAAGGVQLTFTKEGISLQLLANYTPDLHPSSVKSLIKYWNIKNNFLHKGHAGVGCICIRGLL